MNKTSIDWPGLTHTWNPVVGCERGCSYCYAKKMNDRFKWLQDFSQLKVFPERFNDPSKVNKPSKIFVGSMTDICYWDHQWIESILGVCKANSRHTFMFLTKDPGLLNDYDFLNHNNVVVGATITGLESRDALLYKYYTMSGFRRKFLSIEPLMGCVKELPLSEYEHVIVGAMTGPGAIKPKREWINSIQHPNIHYKDNILKHFPDLRK